MKKKKKAYTGVHTNLVLLPFLGALLRKAAVSFFVSVCPSARSHVHPPAGNNLAPSGHIFMKFDVLLSFLKKVCRENSSFRKIRQE